MNDWTATDWSLAVAAGVFFWVLAWIQLGLMESRAEKRIREWEKWKANERGAANVKDFEEYRRQRGERGAA